MPSPAIRCPSAQPGLSDVRVLGLVVPTEEGRRVAYLNAEVPATAEALGQVPPALLGAVVRLSAACEASRCTHFDGQSCRLAARVAEGLRPVVDRLPACTIRRSCRWFAQEGAAVCLRCPQVTTSVRGDGELAPLAHPSAAPPHALPDALLA